MKIETSRKFLNCTIIAYSFLRNGYNYCLANVFRKMEIAYNNGITIREIPMKEEYLSFTPFCTTYPVRPLFAS